MAQRQVVRFRGARYLACGFVLILLAGGVVLPSPADASPDHQMEMNAREAFAAGRFDEALSLFAKLYAETLHPVYLRNIGRCHQKMRDPQKAIDSFRDYLAKAKKVSPDERTEIEGYIREMEALQTEQSRTVTADKPIPAQAPASPAAQPAVAPAPAAVPGPAPASPPTISLASNAGAGSEQNGGDQRESPAPLYTRWWLWTGVGAVVVGGVVAAVLLSSGTSRPACTAPLIRCM